MRTVISFPLKPVFTKDWVTWQAIF